MRNISLDFSICLDFGDWVRLGAIQQFFKLILRIERLNLLYFQGEILKKNLFEAQSSQSMVVIHVNLPWITKFVNFIYFFDATDGILIEYN